VLILTAGESEDMEQLKLSSNFFNAIEKDPRISITHIGLYAALCQYSKGHGGINPIEVFSHQIMQIAKISSPVTYHKSIKELNAYGYIKYQPSFNKHQGSSVHLLWDI
jgi:hypothetical protein